MTTIAFDLDDTLYDRTQPLRQALLEIDEAKSLPFHKFLKVFQQNSDIAFEKVKDHIWTLEESHIFRIRNTLHQLGIDISLSKAQNFQDQYKKNQQQIEPFPCILEILDFLQTKNIQTIIITNGPSTSQRNKINNLRLNKYFSPEQIIVSEEENIAKPDIGIFRLAESRFKLDRTKTWFIGDSYVNDIVGAANAGWNTIWFNRNYKIKNEKTNLLKTKTVFSSLELKDYLFDMFKNQ
ncbi:HAD family hydrolase [Caldifermentibacillus hisashii]|jgi:putative hydrolase of the HAD superfamily|uniref:HAD family hydrolase n=1 Tax=Caldifermentibacillus hisashii TaxID=996558 RepID=A0ABU9K1I3_9BACI